MLKTSGATPQLPEAAFDRAAFLELRDLVWAAPVPQSVAAYAVRLCGSSRPTDPRAGAVRQGLRRLGRRAARLAEPGPRRQGPGPARRPHRADDRGRAGRRGARPAASHHAEPSRRRRRGHRRADRRAAAERRRRVSRRRLDGAVMSQSDLRPTQASARSRFLDLRALAALAHMRFVTRSRSKALQRPASLAAAGRGRRVRRLPRILAGRRPAPARLESARPHRPAGTSGSIRTKPIWSARWCSTPAARCSSAAIAGAVQAGICPVSGHRHEPRDRPPAGPGGPGGRGRRAARGHSARRHAEPRRCACRKRSKRSQTEPATDLAGAPARPVRPTDAARRAAGVQRFSGGRPGEDVRVAPPVPPPAVGGGRASRRSIRTRSGCPRAWRTASRAWRTTGTIDCSPAEIRQEYRGAVRGATPPSVRGAGPGGRVRLSAGFDRDAVSADAGRSSSSSGAG